MRLLLLMILVYCGGDSIALATRFLLLAAVRDGGERLVIICDWGRRLYRGFVQEILVTRLREIQNCDGATPLDRVGASAS
jgi:hypothetical protein